MDCMIRFSKFRLLVLLAILAMMGLVFDSAYSSSQPHDQGALLQEAEIQIEKSRTVQDFWKVFQKYLPYMENQLKAYPILLKQFKDDVRGLKGNNPDLATLKLCYGMHAEFFQELNHYQDRLAVNTKAGDSGTRVLTIQKMADLCQRHGNFSQALEFYQQTFQECKNGDHSQLEGVVLNNMGATYFALKASSDALNRLNEALEKAHAMGNKKLEVVVLNNLAATHSFLGEYEKATDLHRAAIKSCKNIGDRDGEWLHLTGLESVLEKLCEKYPDTSKYWDEKRTLSLARGNWLPAYVEDINYSVISNEEVYPSIKQLVEYHKRISAAVDRS